VPEVGIASRFASGESLVMHSGDCLDLLREIPSESIRLIITSPPYNLGKAYERRQEFSQYLKWQDEIIAECVRVLHPQGSLCWQVGNFIDGGEVVPLDVALYPHFKSRGLKMRNRIVWHFEHGLHCSRRLSGRHETIMWFTKGDDYLFNLDAIRVPQKYPGKKHYKGPKVGQLSCNPLGKNPGDVWIIPNVKHNHVEKTLHPCQFPVELAERLVLSTTAVGDWVLDPFAGVGSALVAAVRHGRRAAGAEIDGEYVAIAKGRIHQASAGVLRVRSAIPSALNPLGEKMMCAQGA